MVFIIIAGAVFLADLLIKNKISVMSSDAFPKSAGKYISIERMYNKGFAGSFLEKKPETVKSVVLFILSIAGIVSIPYLLFAKKHPVTRTGLAFLLGGAASNVADRKYRDHVVDYIRFKNPGTGRKGKLVFNISDFFIAIGGALILIGKLFKK